MDTMHGLIRVLIQTSLIPLVAIAVLLGGCGKKEAAPNTASTESAPASNAASTDAADAAAAANGAPPVPAPAVTQASWSPDALEELLAPIALYPDQLLGQILA